MMALLRLKVLRQSVCNRLVVGEANRACMVDGGFGDVASAGAHVTILGSQRGHLDLKAGTLIPTVA
jgi:hypothetical protein